MEDSKKFGDPENPLLVSVRSGARASMPGMMDTVLNQSLNNKIVHIYTIEFIKMKLFLSHLRNSGRLLVFSLILFQGCVSRHNCCFEMQDPCSEIVKNNKFIYAIHDSTICSPNFFDDISWVSFYVKNNFSNDLEKLVKDDFKRISARDTRHQVATVMVRVIEKETKLELVMELIERAFVSSNAKNLYECYHVTFIYQNENSILPPSMTEF